MLGTEYLSSNTDLAYPFTDDVLGVVRDAAAVVHGAIATIPIGAIVDALASVPTATTELYLKSVTSMGGTDYLFAFADQYGVVLISELVDTSTFTAGLPFQRLALGDISGSWIKLAVDTALCTSWLSGITSVDTYGTSLQLLDAVLLADTDHVKSLQLYDDGLTNPPTSPKIVGRVQLKAGYNSEFTLLSETDTGVPGNNELTFTVVPGAGQGLSPCVPATPDPQPLAFPVQADSAGNINLQAGDDCYTIVPVPEIGVLQIQGVCKACCSCEDYESVLAALDRLFVQTKCAHCLLVDAHNGPNALPAASCSAGVISACGLPAPAGPTDPFWPATAGNEVSYTNGVRIFNASLSPVRSTAPVLIVAGMRGAAYTGSNQHRMGAPNYVTFVATIRNAYTEDVQVSAFAYTPVLNGGGAALVQLAWEYARVCADGIGGDQIAPSATDPTPIASGKTCKVYIYLRTTDDKPLSASGSAHITVNVTVENLPPYTVGHPHVTWALSQEVCV